MKLRMRVLAEPLLLAIMASFLLLAAASTTESGIENLTCEQIGPGVYRLDYRAAPDAGPVEVFASSRPDRIDSKPVFTIRKTPAEVSLPGQTNRIYFHLKPASGSTRVVSIRRLPLEGAKNRETELGMGSGSHGYSTEPRCTGDIDGVPKNARRGGQEKPVGSARGRLASLFCQ